MKRLIFSVILALFALPAQAGKPVVEAVRAEPSGSGWTFHVTLRHGDEGWDHYADGWGVYTEDGTELGYRVLLHPHVTEQPFTRSLSHVQVPDGATRVLVIPRDSVHGTGAPFVVDLR